VSERWRWAALGFVVAVSAFFHGAVLLNRPVVIDPDAPSYIRPALEIVRHHRFYGSNPLVYAFPQPGNKRLGPETIRTPGYPLFLGAIVALGLPLATAVWVQHLVGVALAAAVFLFVDLVLHRRAAALVAGLLIGTNPPLVFFAHQYMADLLAAAAVVAALFCTYRLTRGSSMRWAVAAGLLTGCATLIRPIAFAWFVPLAAIVAMRAARTVTAAFLAAALVLPLAWMARNYAATGVATISSIAEENVLLGNAAGALALRDKPLLIRLTAMQQSSGFYNVWEKLKPGLADAALAEARADGIDPRRAPHAVLSRYYARLGWRILLRHIPEAAELSVSALIEMFLYTYARTAAAWISSGSPLLVLAIAGAGAIFAAAIGGLVVLRREDPALAWLLAVTIVYFAILPAIGGADLRFAVPFTPAYAIAAGVGIEPLITRRGRAATA
jgi:4-amino-4-deoxy-L-arabinose transferase-like glycosyltransferase